MENQQIEKLLTGGENQKVEFKDQLRDHIVLANLIGSFANTDGGKILIGIREPMEVVGCDRELVAQLYERTNSALKPIPVTKLEFYTFKNKEIAIIEIQKSANLVLSAGRIYSRAGESTIPMSVEDIKNKISVSFGQVNYEKNIEIISSAIEIQSKIISELRDGIKQSGSIKSKLKDYIIGGIIGAILGLLASLFAGLG